MLIVFTDFTYILLYANIILKLYPLSLTTFQLLHSYLRTSSIENADNGRKINSNWQNLDTYISYLGVLFFIMVRKQMTSKICIILPKITRATKAKGL